jgi:acyl-CoA dehydrogenase
MAGRALRIETVFDRLDATLALPEDERLVLDAVRTLAREQVEARAAHYDRSGEFPWDNVKAINALGLNGMFIPEDYGGCRLSRSICRTRA